MNKDNNKYRLLIEGLKQEYIGRNPFATKISFCGEEPCVEENDFSDLVAGDLTIKVTWSEDERYKQIKKYEIVSKSDQKKWSLLLVPTGTLFAKNKLALRKDWLDKYSIRGIITLKNSFFGVYAMPVSIIILDEQHSSVWLTSATSTEDILDILSDISQYKRKVYYTEKLDPENFMPEFYNEELKQINEKLDKYDTKELQDIAEIILGRNVECCDFEEEGIPYLRVRNVQEGSICNLNSYVRPDCAEKYAKQLLQEGDILLSKNFGQHKVARVNEEDLPAIASNGFFIIRAYGVPEDYLYQYFTSETGKAILEKQLSSIEHGTVITSISKKDLMKLKIPIFDKATMVDMGNIENANVVELIKNMSTGISGRIKASELEQYVFQQFLDKGWSTNDVLMCDRSFSIRAYDNRKWTPDMLLLDGDRQLAVVEVKTNLFSVNPEIFRILQYVINNCDIPFVILVTVGYFEIHGMKNNVIKKSTVAPTKEELLQLLEGKEEA